MAELALAATIIGLITTGAHLVKKVAVFVEALEDAPEGISDILSELRNVNDILQEIEQPLKTNANLLDDTLSRRVQAVTKDCTKTFSGLVKLFDRLGRPGSKKQRFFFVFYADNIGAARTSLQAHKASLTLILQLVARRDFATTVGLIQQLIDQYSAKPISTSSEEVSGALLVDAAASVSLKVEQPPASKKIVQIEPGPPPPNMEPSERASEASTAVGRAEISSEYSASGIPSKDEVEPEPEPEPKPVNRSDTTDTGPVETQDGMALILAAGNGDLEMTELLLEFDIDPNSVGGFHGSALQAAAFCGHLEIVSRLITKGANVSRTGHRWGSPLGAAIQGSHVEIVKALLEAKADPDGDAVLITAAANGLVKAVKYLLKYGANPDIHGGFHGSALQAAAFCGHLETIRVLLDAGADANASGHRWGSPIQAAVQGGHKDIARMLMEHKRRAK